MIEREPVELSVAQHEAAHIVVGVALGLRLKRASARPVRREKILGYAWFADCGHDAAHALMYAAGVAWERAIGARLWRTEPDCALVRKLAPGRGGLEANVRAAGLMLASLGSAHARVTRALLDRDLSARHILELTHAPRLTRDD